MAEYDYDLLVIGSGPAGQKAAIAAAKLGKRVGIVEKEKALGGVCIHTGTIPSKTMREAVMSLSGYRARLQGDTWSTRKITMPDLLARCQHVVRSEVDVVRRQLQRNDVEMIAAEASFIDPHTIALNSQSEARKATARFILIAVGTVPTAAPPIPGAYDSDTLLQLDHLPKTMCVIGGGVVGCEYASMFAALGVRVTLVEKRERLLPFVDSEIVEALSFHLREQRLVLRLHEEVNDVTRAEEGEGRVLVRLKSGKTIVCDTALFSAGRLGATAALGIDRAGITADDRGRIAVNDKQQTSVPHIYAAGDVVGFPCLASVSMEQGRIAALHAFGREAHSVPAFFPYGIYTVPEISMLGKTEEELTEESRPYEIGKAMYKEIARGQIIGDEQGVLKLLFCPDTHILYGVHIMGEGASELIHIGQAVMALKGTVDYFVQTVFNYPTLAECYKVAALDGLNRLAR